MTPALNILFLEDSSDDLEIMKYELERSEMKFSAKRVFTKADFLDALDNFEPDIILSDYTLPMFNGMHAFKLFKEKNLSIPFILVTGTLTDQLAQECVAEGVDDFILKTQYNRLPALIHRNIQIKKTEAELNRVNEELKKLKQISEKERAQQMLSEREYEILCLISSGKTIKEIADQLFLSPATVATYRSRLLEKLDLKSNVELTRYAMQNKLIN